MAGGLDGGSVVGTTTTSVAPEASLLLSFSEARQQQTVVQQVGGVPSLSGAAVPEDAGGDGLRVLLTAPSEHGGQACSYHSGPVVITPEVCARMRVEPPI